MKTLFRIYTDSSNLYQSVLLANGAFYSYISEYFDHTEPVPVDKRLGKLEGQILRTIEDLENNYSVYVVVRDQGVIKLKCIHKTSIVDIPIVKPQENLSVVQFQVRGDDTRLLIQNGKKYQLFKQVAGDTGPSLKLQHTFETDKITGILHSGCAYDIEKHMFLVDEKNFYVVKLDPEEVIVHENIYCIGF